MMLRKNNKGFTMVEMLAAVVIMGILASIGIVSVVHLRANQKAKFNQSQTEIFRQTAKNYFTDNKSKLPTTIMSTERIYLEELIKNNYLDELLDYDKESYNIADSYVEVRKLGSGIYVYNPVLYEKGQDESIKYDDGDKPGEVKILAYIKDKSQSPSLGCNKNNKKQLDCTGKGDEEASEYYTNGDIRLNISAKDDDGMILYRYYIYKNDKVIKVSDFIEVPESQRLTGYNDEYISLNKNEYSDGIYKIKYVVYDMKGHRNTTTSKKIYIDTTKPSCRTTKTPNVVWANKDVKVEGICSDSGSGCLKNYSQKYTTEMNRDVALGTVIDAAGNITQCGSISVKIDKTAPECNVSGESTSYIKGTRIISTDCKDSGSGCVSSKVDHKYSTTATTATLNETVKDVAGNTTVCKKKVSIYVDNTAPRCESSGGSTSWRTSQFYIKGACSDDNSGCSGDAKTLINTDRNRNESPGTVCDKVGNCTKCPNQTVKLDTTPPSVPNISNPNNGNWSTTDFSLNLSSSDNLSGMNRFRYSYDNKNWNNYANSNRNNFTTTPFSVERNQPVYISACDNVGNCSGSSSTQIKILKNVHVNYTAYYGVDDNPQDVRNNSASDGKVGGTTGQGLAIKNIKLGISSNPEIGGSIVYRAHRQTYGDSRSDVPAGSTMCINCSGAANYSNVEKRLEQIEIELTGEVANYFDVYYRVHVRSQGWLTTVSNGRWTGSTGLCKRIEAIQIQVVPKTSNKPNFGAANTDIIQITPANGSDNCPKVKKVYTCHDVPYSYTGYDIYPGWTQQKCNEAGGLCTRGSTNGSNCYCRVYKRKSGIKQECSWVEVTVK